jgi:hypothetical protein
MTSTPFFEHVAWLYSGFDELVSGACEFVSAGCKAGEPVMVAVPGAKLDAANNHITVTPIAPATASRSTFTFPITGGRLNTKTMHGVIRHSGGIMLSNGTAQGSPAPPDIVPDKHGVSVFALVRHHTRHVCGHIKARHRRFRCRVVMVWSSARVATVTNTSVSNGSPTGTVNIPAFAARAINRLAGKHVVSAGDVLGTASVTPTLK